MRKRDLDRFRKLLLEQRERILGNVQRALADDIHDERDTYADEVDTASSETSLAFSDRLRQREQGLLNKINQTLQKIDDGIYGECESCGEQIDVKRLRARPVADLCIDCKSEQETLERRMA